jgi:hypothetical protein
MDVPARPYLEELKRQVCLYRRGDTESVDWGPNYIRGEELLCSVCGRRLLTVEMDEYKRCDLRLSHDSRVQFWSRKWAHTQCVIELYSKWAGRRDAYFGRHFLPKIDFRDIGSRSHGLLVVKEWATWKHWLRTRAEHEWYITHDSIEGGPHHVNCLKTSENILYKELSTFCRIEHLHREKRGACALLCLQECGLPWDIAWPIAAIAYWLV